MFETPLVLVNPRLSNNRFDLEWIGPTNRCTLESSTNLSSLWTLHTPGATSATAAASGDVQFFRLKR